LGKQNAAAFSARHLAVFMAAAGDAWEGFNVCDMDSSQSYNGSLVTQDLKAGIIRFTVDRLKAIITALNDECGTVISKTAKKQELIDRIAQQLDEWKLSGNVDKWTKAKGILEQVRLHGT